MEFLDRELELATLREHLLARPGAGLFVLYGRRRIGKTELLRRALEGVPRAAYHVATHSTLAEELRRLSATLARAWSVPLLAAQPLASAEALLAFLSAVEGRAVLALDEFPYLVESCPELPGLLQACWDETLAHRDLKLIVCGSSIAMMERTFFSPRNPLFGRRTGQLRLGPLAPHHLGEAFPWKLPEVVELAALFGGVPGYLARLDPALSLGDNLRQRVLAVGEPLYEEVPFLLREELREPRVYYAILATIAGGAQKFGEISSKVGLDRANLNRYLATLAELGLLEREVPVTERHPEKSRRGLYRIADPFIATWFAFVHPHRDRLERGEVDEVWRTTIQPALPAYLSRAVKRVLQSLFTSGPLAAVVPFSVGAAGRYWSPTAEFDLVFLDQERRRAFVAEVKWGGRPVAPGLLADLRCRVAGEGAFAGLDVTCAVISRAGFTDPEVLDDSERLIDFSGPPAGSDGGRRS